MTAMTVGWTGTGTVCWTVPTTDGEEDDSEEDDDDEPHDGTAYVL